MAEMMTFISWLISEVPQFLMTPPISAFTAILIMYWLGALVWRMMHIA